MENSAPVLIFCIEECHYLDPFEQVMKYSKEIAFQVVISTKSWRLPLQISFSQWMEAMHRYLPEDAAYVKRLTADMDMMGRNDARVVKALETEGYDFWRVLYAFLEQEDLEALHQAALQEEKDDLHKRESQSESEKASQRKKTNKLASTLDIIALANEISTEVYELAKKVYEPAFFRLPGFDKDKPVEEKQLLRFFAENVSWYLVKVLSIVNGLSEWPEEDARRYLPQNRRKFLLSRRQLPNGNNPLVEVKILDFEYTWEFNGINKVDVWYQCETEAGTHTMSVPFHDLIEEAELYFPAIFNRIRHWYEVSEGFHPREKEIVAGLLTDKIDMEPVVASFVQFYENVAENQDSERHFQGDDGVTFFEFNRNNHPEKKMDGASLQDCFLKSQAMEQLFASTFRYSKESFPDFFVKAPAHLIQYFTESVWTSIQLTYAQK